MNKNTNLANSVWRKLSLLSLFCVFSFALFAQTKTVTGIVKSSDDGQPLIGVTVMVKGTTSGSITDLDGKYSVVLKNKDAILVFSMIGMKTTEISVGNQTVINLDMASNVQTLEQVVVTGYMTQKKVDLTGAVSVAKMQDVKDIPTGNPMRSLQGHIPGLYVESSGQPDGGNNKVLIRGVNTLGNPDPLYIIDGVPTKDPQVFASISPGSISSVQVLKDASSASIYGARASNGVIIVTTKDGKGGEQKERINIQFNTSFSLQTEKPWREDVLNAEQRGRALWQGAVNDKTNPDNALYTYDWNNDYNNPILQKINIAPYVGGDKTEPVGNTNWQDELYRTSILTQQDLTLTTGTSKSSLLINMNYYHNDGIMKYTYFKRYSGRVNGYINFMNDKVKVGENLQIAASSQNLSTTDLGGVTTPELAVTLAPTIPVYKTDGTFAGPLGAGYSDRNNPIDMQYLSRWNKNNKLNILGNVYLEFTPVKNLVLKTSYGIDHSHTLIKTIKPAFQEGFIGRGINSLSLLQGDLTTLTWTNTANYKYTIAKNNFNFLLGSEAIHQDYQSFGAYREGFAIEDEDYYVLDAGTGLSTNNGSATGYSLFSLFGKVNYAYEDKYLASATIRRDGSSRFGSNSRYGLFPAFTLGWRLNNEGFFKGVKNVSNLKLRAGYGRVGNQEIGNVARFGLYQANYGNSYGNGLTWPGPYLNVGTAYDLNGSKQGTLPSGYVQIQGENQNLKWESTDEINLGIDFGFLNEKISGSFDYFGRKTKDILIQPPVAAQVGEGKVKWLNGASMDNRGWEFNLNYNDKIGKLTYNVSINGSHFRDKITKLPEDVRAAYPGNSEQTILGHSALSIFGYQTDGIFKSQDEVTNSPSQTGKGIGRIRYKDLNGDNVINSLDQTWLGTYLPSLEYGLKIDLSYENFDFSLFGSGVAGKTGYDPAKQFNSFLTVNQNNGPGVLNAWTPQNPNSNIPMLSLVNANDEYRTSDFFMVNGSYFKLRNVQIGYTFPKAIVSLFKLEKIRIYLIAQNVFALKSKEYLAKDPERIGGFSNWPQPTVYTFGANISF